MEATVTISVKEYDDLRMLKKSVESGDSIYGNGYPYISYSVISKEEAVKIAFDQLKSLSDLCHRKEVELGRVSRMNWFQFRQWKHSR